MTTANDETPVPQEHVTTEQAEPLAGQVVERLTPEQLELAARMHAERTAPPVPALTDSGRRSPVHYVIHPGDVPRLRAHPRGAEVLAAIGYDEFGRRTSRRLAEPIVTPTVSAAGGFTGIDVRQGRVYQEYNENLQSLVDRMTVYEEMRRSEPAFATCENLITIPIANTQYWFEPGDRNDPDSVDFAEFLNWNLSDGLTRAFNETMREAALGVFYGFTWAYPRYELKRWRGKPYWGWRQFAPRARATVDRWRFDDDGGLQGLVQYGELPSTGEARYVNYDIEEILLWTWRGDSNDPEGLGAFRQAYKPYFYKTAFEEFAAIRIERQAVGIPVAKGPLGMYDSTDEAKVMAILNNIRVGHDAGFVIPTGWEIYMLDLGDSNIPFESHIERQHQGMLQSVGAQFVAYNQGGADGSNAAMKDASSTFYEGVNYMASWACEPINRFEVPRLMERNWRRGMSDKQPKLMHGRVGVRDLEKFMRAVELPFRERTELPDDVMERLATMLGMSPSKTAEWLEEQKQRLMEERAREAEALEAQTQATRESGTQPGTTAAETPAA